MPKVSVIIPTYNCAAYLSEAVESVFKQTYTDFEVIIVNDGSTDNTDSIVTQCIQRYSKKIKYIVKKNQGPGAARNRGIEEANGEYIAFLDADDIWLPRKLEYQVPLLETNPDIALVFTDTEIFNEIGTLRASSVRSSQLQSQGTFRWKILQRQFNDGFIMKENLFQELLRSNHITTSTVLVRKKCFESSGYFPTDINVGEDYDLWIRISEKFLVIFLNTVTARYRKREESTSGNSHLRDTKYDECNAIVHEKAVKRLPCLYCDFKKNIYQAYASASWGYLNNSQLDKARELALKSLAYYKFQPKLYLYVLLSFFPKNFVQTIHRLKHILV